MQRIAVRWWSAVALTGLACGCGNGEANLPPPANPPQPVTVAPAAAPANQAAAPGATKAATKKAKAAPLPFANENPANVFQVASTAETMTTEVAPRFFENEKFVVASGAAGVDSSTFTAVGKPRGQNPAPPPAANSFKLPDGFTALPDFGTSDDGAPLRIRCTKDDSLMALVPAGTAIVGSDTGPSESQPSFQVFLDSFYMDVTEITAAQFEQYRDDLREQKKRVPPPSANANAGDGWPALGVSWGDAQNYTRWAGKELPTEAEFEKAARGPLGFHSPWGNGRSVWASPRTPKTLVAVGVYLGDQSPYGIYDLAGNAREWTADFYRPNAHQEAAEQAATKALRNWTGPKSAAMGSQRVIKGAGDDWAMWHRAAADMSATLPDVSFRGVLRLNQPKSTTETGTPKAGTPKGGTPKGGTPKPGF